MTEYRCNTEGCSADDCDNCRAVAALLADKARLDWWQAQRTHTLAPVMDAEGWRLHEADHLRPLAVPFRRTLREAIDAARLITRPMGTTMPETAGVQILTDADPDPRDIIESCSQKCLRDVLTDRGLELMASDGDFAMNCYECRECNSWCLRHEVEP